MAKLFGKVSARFFPDSIFYGPKYYYSIKETMKSTDKEYGENKAKSTLAATFIAYVTSKIKEEFEDDSTDYISFSLKGVVIDGEPAGDYKLTVSKVTDEDSSYEEMDKFLTREIDLLKQEHESDPRGLSDEKIEKHNMLINIRDQLTKVCKL